MVFTIKHKDKKTNARIGLLQTKRGNIETPFFMPVATKASVKHLTSEELEKIGVNAVISNMFILHTNPGEKLIKKLGGISKFMNFKGINVTDSGGFQMYSKEFHVYSNNKGVCFRNPFTGEKLFITPKQDMKIQLDLKSDIAMCLDSMPLYGKSKKEIQDAVEKTTLWAKQCKSHHDELQKNIPKNKRQLLFGITQGGTFKDLREISSKQLADLDFDGYSIGGLGLGEPNKELYEMVKTHKKHIKENKPIYLMGIGHPSQILEAISLGVDMFDSTFPTQNARRGTLFTKKGKLKILNSKYKQDKSPIDKECDCYVCKNYSKSYIRYQIMMNEAVGMKLATYHNIYFITKLIEQAKEKIKQNKFKEFKQKIQKAYD